MAVCCSFSKKAIVKLLIVKFLILCKSLRLLFEYRTICAKLFILLIYFLRMSKIISTFVVKYFTYKQLII